MNKVAILPMYVENEIEKQKDEMFRKHNLFESFPNALLREDVLDLLDMFCTVVYYPLDNETNNGFHVTNIPFANGERKNFVYINTAQTMEKQVFTAAHELGHIWNIDSTVISQLDLDDTPDIREMIINRFAASLLIPKEIFVKSAKKAIDEFREEDGRIRIGHFLRSIVTLMNLFFVPMKSIVLRLFELEMIPMSTAELLLGYTKIPLNDLEQYINSLIAELGYIKFQQASRKKWISGLVELLDAAEKSEMVQQRKIDRIRELFDLKPSPSIITQINDVLPIPAQEEN